MSKNHLKARAQEILSSADVKIGGNHYRTFMEVAHRSLRTGGRFYLATIGANQSVRFTDAWIDRYIFAASILPSIKQIGAAMEGLFVMEEWHN